MKGLGSSRRGLLVLAVSAVMVGAVAPVAMGGAEPWTTRPFSDASYVATDDRIPSMRWVSDADFVPQPERVALNRVLSDARYYPTVAQPVAPGAHTPVRSGATPNTLPLIVGLLAVIAGAAGLVVALAGRRLRAAI